MDKFCPSCSTNKPSTDFYANAKRHDGLSSYCKTCAIAAAQANYVPRPPKERPPEGFKKCSACQTIKPLTEFGKNRTSADGFQYACKPCQVKSVTASRRKDPTSHRRSSKNWREANTERHAGNNLRWKYGVAHGTYERLFELQGGKCAICETTDPGARLDRFHLDHCHDTNVVRGLLCSRCNTGIGQLRHSVDLLLKAGDYLLKEPPEVMRDE